MKRYLLTLLGATFLMGACASAPNDSVPKIPKNNSNFRVEQNGYIYVAEDYGFGVYSDNESGLPSMRYIFGSCKFDTDKTTVMDIYCNKKAELVSPFPKNQLQWGKAVMKYKRFFRTIKMNSLIEKFESD